MGKLEKRIKCYEDGITPFLNELKGLVNQSKTLAEPEKAAFLQALFYYEYVTLGALKTATSLQNLYGILEKRVELLEEQPKEVLVKAYKAIKEEGIISSNKRGMHYYPILEELLGKR